jgi:hypothetical protein
MAKTAKGHIEQLRSESLRVKVYAGTDPVTGKPRQLRETCPDYPSALEALGRLLKQAEGHQAPDRDATFGRVLDRYLEVTEFAATTRVTHESDLRRTRAAWQGRGWTGKVLTGQAVSKYARYLTIGSMGEDAEPPWTPEERQVTELIDYDAFCGTISDEAAEAAIGSTITARDLKGMLDGNAGFKDAVHVGGGVLAWVSQVDPSLPTY